MILLWRFIHFSLVAIAFAAFWASCHLVQEETQARRKDAESKAVLRFFRDKRDQLPNIRKVRLCQLLAAIGYVALLSYGPLFRPSSISPGVLIGLLLGYFLVAAAGLGAVALFVPSFEKLLFDYGSVISLAIFLLQVIFVNFSNSFGLTLKSNYYIAMLVYNIVLPMEELNGNPPFIAIAGALHCVNHLQSNAMLVIDPAQSMGCIAMYIALGILLPFVVSLLLKSSKPIKLPTEFYSALYVAANGLLAADLLLSTPSIVEPIQNLDDGAWQEWLLGLFLASEDRVGELEEGPGCIKIGLSLTFGIGLGGASLVSMVLSSWLIFLMEESDEEPKGLQAVLAKIPAASGTLRSMQQMPSDKKSAVCCLLAVMSLQGSTIVYVLVRIQLEGLRGFNASAPQALLVFLVGVGLEVIGGLYVVIPSVQADGPKSENIDTDRSQEGKTLVRKSFQDSRRASFQDPRQMSLQDPRRMSFQDPRQMSLQDPRRMSFQDLRRSSRDFRHEHSGVGLSTNGSGSFDGGHRLPNRRGNSANWGNAASAAPGTLPSFDEHAEDDGCDGLLYVMRAARLEALASFKSYMQGLDSQSQAYSLNEFIQGAATAFKGIFPGVHHASFYLLNSGNVSINMYTFVGEEAQNPPQINVAVVKGSMVHYVLKACDSVFINDIAEFSGRSSPDIQYLQLALGLTSVACLPLLVADQRILGCLQIGFEEARIWTDFEMLVARKLAIVLSSGSQNLGGSRSLERTPQDVPPHNCGDIASPGAGLAWQGSHASSSPRQQDVQYEQGILGGRRISHDDRRRQHQPRASISQSSMRSEGMMLASGQASPATVKTGPPQMKDLSRESSKSLASAQGWSFDNDRETDDVKMVEIIGRGGFGSVYKALWRGEICAVKVLEHGEDLMGCHDAKGGNSKAEADMSGRRAALMEGAISTTISHPNVVSTYDYRVMSLNPQERGPGLPSNRAAQETHIIMEFCDRGSMQDAMEHHIFQLPDCDENACGLDMDLIVMTLAEVSAAMDFLHLHRITHRDLKPKNVLLKTSRKDRRGFIAKVSDFGLSQVLSEVDCTEISTKFGGTVSHMPPELIEDGKVYQQGDVYAFGIMMWEIYTGTVPYAHMAHPQIMVAVVTHNLRPKFPKGCPEWYKALAAKCWRKDPKTRPSFKDVTTYLMTMLSENCRGWKAVDDS